MPGQIYRNEQGVYCTVKNTGYTPRGYVPLAQRGHGGSMPSTRWGDAHSEPKRRLIAFLLWYLGGPLGFHNLYMDRTKKFINTLIWVATLFVVGFFIVVVGLGCIYMVRLIFAGALFWLLGKWALDLFVILFGDSLDDHGRNIFS